MNPYSWFYRSFTLSKCSCTAVTVVVAFALAWSSFVFCDEIQAAAGDGDLAKVQALLKANPDLVSSRDGNGDTPLHYAAARGHLDIAKLLLANKAPVNAKNSVGETPLHSAATTGHTEVAELLLANRADVNARTNIGTTPLHFAAYSGYKEVARLLLANNAEVNARDDEGATPLHRAARHHRDLAALLRQHGGQDLSAAASPPTSKPSTSILAAPPGGATAADDLARGTMSPFTGDYYNGLATVSLHFEAIMSADVDMSIFDSGSIVVPCVGQTYGCVSAPGMWIRKSRLSKRGQLRQGNEVGDVLTLALRGMRRNVADDVLFVEDWRRLPGPMVIRLYLKGGVFSGPWSGMTAGVVESEEVMTTAGSTYDFDLSWEQAGNGSTLKIKARK